MLINSLAPAASYDEAARIHSTFADAYRLTLTRHSEEVEPATFHADDSSVPAASYVETAMMHRTTIGWCMQYSSDEFHSGEEGILYIHEQLARRVDQATKTTAVMTAEKMNIEAVEPLKSIVKELIAHNSILIDRLTEQKS